MLVKKGQNNKIINLHDNTVIYTSTFVYSIVRKQCKRNSVNFVLCSCEFSSKISHDILQNFVRKVSLLNDISSEISRKYRLIFQKDKRKIAISKIRRSEISHGN